jgi:phage replication-related protein YjqB (UPF0714/DUF867 family)
VSWPELLAHPDVTETATLDGPVGLMAFHAGLESGTLEIATAAAAASGSSLYTVCQPADLRWHVPSAEVDPGQAPALAAWLAHVERAIAVHGYGRRTRPWDVLVGGADRARVGEVADGLRSALPGLRIVDDPDDIPTGLHGRHPRNPVNRPRRGGVQVELPIRARLGPVADEVATALAAVASRWAAGTDGAPGGVTVPGPPPPR